MSKDTLYEVKHRIRRYRPYDPALPSTTKKKFTRFRIGPRQRPIRRRQPQPEKQEQNKKQKRHPSIHPILSGAPVLAF